MHNLFIKNQNNFYESIKNIFIKNDILDSHSFNEKDLINNDLYFQNNLNLLASACYMTSYNILELKNDKEYTKTLNNYFENYKKIINENLVMDNDFEELNEISEYAASNIGIDFYEYNEICYDSLYYKINREKEEIKNKLEKIKKDMLSFIKELKNTPLPEEPDLENQYRILSFPWCISGNILSNIKFLKMNEDKIIHSKIKDKKHLK